MYSGPSSDMRQVTSSKLMTRSFLGAVVPSAIISVPLVDGM